ncbi:hypothetical protein OE09_1011 [Flavobacteriaceae bacterium MAR_2010_72]|nr:hypothetical protein OE09_1011 [Flavobacteriaceae bacterium MAR_2010_72]TVZ60186.1 hypothetical protein NA63_2736 [Flavobacteriaceae bacterium MAR_2010_105]
MIKFFRQIRYSLMEQNKTSKYLKYAIGEIVLVMIGILLALQVNNWNENRKNKLTESKYYCKLLDDFELDRQNIAVLYKESEYKIETSKSLLLELNTKNKDKSYLLNNYLQGLRTNAFVPSKVTITDLISSGKLNLLANDSIKNNLIRYYGELDKFLYQLEINRSKSLERVFLYDDYLQFGNQYYDYVSKSLGNEILKTLPVNDWHLDSESKYYKQFQNDLVFFVTMSEREKQHFGNIMKAMESTYNQLKTECGSNKN